MDRNQIQAQKKMNLKELIEQYDSELSDFDQNEEEQKYSLKKINFNIKMEKCNTTVTNTANFALKNPIINPPLKSHNSSKLSPIKQVSESLKYAMSNAVSNLTKNMG